MQTDQLGKAGATGVMERSGLKPSILLTSHAAEHASLFQRHHHTATDRTPRGSRAAQDEQRLCSGPDGDSPCHALYSLVGLPSNVRSMAEMRGQVLGPGLESSWIFLEGRESKQNESLTRCVQETKDDLIWRLIHSGAQGYDGRSRE
jgi:hypothetical protein